ncbi:MAG: phosphoenolpyruvate carboxylase, partial [Chitinophagaceae bacterium]
VHLVDNLISKVHVFGLHFASLDIRQESSIHGKALEEIAEKEDILPKDYAKKSAEEKMQILTSIKGKANTDHYEDIIQDTMLTMAAVKDIQEYNGPEGCHRYVISQCNTALNVLEVYGLFLLSGWDKKSLSIDIVPLFETVQDLRQAAGIMKTLYENKGYRAHLEKRNMKQTIMVGFSDGTKDGGYFMANWSIYKAKEELTKISLENGVDVVFFDGRGGPPSRGGGKTHKFYASMGKNISNQEIQLTVQGQTVSSNFGTIDSAQFNLEQLIHAGISNDLFTTRNVTLTETEENLLDDLAGESFKAYTDLKNHPDFLDYLSHISPLKFYGQTNIGSRPTKRGGTAKLDLKDLRAIPYVASWSQLKQNVTGYFGLGTALEQLEKAGKFTELKNLYKTSLYFKTLLDNSEMAMNKCYFPLTEHLANNEHYGEIWNKINQEYERTKKFVLKLSGKSELMADYPVDQLSIGVRERIVLPLTTIQQYAIGQIRALEEKNAKSPLKDSYEKLVIRCSFGIINAARNSV